jgi:hypothetical protein
VIEGSEIVASDEAGIAASDAHLALVAGAHNRPGGRNRIEVGDRVLVGGFDYDPTWLRGGDGYAGTVIQVADSVAVVELDDELVLEGTWAAHTEGTVQEARGRWLALLEGLGRRHLDHPDWTARDVEPAPQQFSLLRAVWCPK